MEQEPTEDFQGTLKSGRRFGADGLATAHGTWGTSATHTGGASSTGPDGRTHQSYFSLVQGATTVLLVTYRAGMGVGLARDR